MNWLKNVILDVAVTAVIATWVFSGSEWAYWIIAVYSPFLLLMKLMALSGGVSRLAEQGADTTPVWFYHVIYASNLILLLAGEWWLVAAFWAAIWILSAVQESRTRPSPASRKSRTK